MKTRPSIKPWGTACVAALMLAGCGSGDDEAPPAALPDLQPVALNVKPGPAALNDPAPRAPQLENTGIWQAAPILVSGASAYRKGEFLYQDWLYDDRGATTNGPSAPTRYNRSGRYTYPTDVGTYYENLADLDEVRLKPTATDTAFRLTFNAMSNPALVGTTVALGGSAGTLRAVPFGANAAWPAEVFVTVRGTTGTVSDAATGAALATIPVTNDYERRQVEFRVPFSVYDPRGKTAVRVAAASGLWNAAANAYHVPGTTATATTPGGAGTNVPNPPAFFNVAFRFNEPNPALGTFTRWRDGVQGSVLAATTLLDGVQTHDLSVFHAEVNFAKLAAGSDDDLPGTATGVPQRGFINRVYASPYETQQGIGNPAAPDLFKERGCRPDSLRSADGTASCVPQFAGRLQNYSLFIPDKAPPEAGYGLISDLHGAGDNYNRNPPVTVERTLQLADAGTGSLVFITQGRGGAYWWAGQASAEIWNVMRDILAHYKVDRDKIVAGGISQGGYGSIMQAAAFPDLYAAAIPHVPCVSAGTGYNGTNAPGGAGTFLLPMLDSLRHVPTVVSAGERDSTCAWEHEMGNKAIRDRLDALGYRYEHWSFPAAGHTFAMQACNGISPKPCAYSFLSDFLEGLVPLKRVSNPARVTYVTSDARNQPEYGVVGDHAYWISGLTLRDPAKFYGKVDVLSHGLGEGAAVPNPTQKSTGSDFASGQTIAYNVYNRWFRTLAAGPAVAKRNEVDITASNVSRLVIDGVRAGVDCQAKLNVNSDGPLEVVIGGCLAGDLNLDHQVDCRDVAAIRALAGTGRQDSRYDVRADLTRDGRIDAADADAALKSVAGGSCPA
ncbi:prolyl oligopeptidase family serine peptidase [Piscinibacter sakaiensis]|nr:prolyl oligopeptidase family serine peptidase [Piscinibacter sakaiensis]